MSFGSQTDIDRFSEASGDLPWMIDGHLFSYMRRPRCFCARFEFVADPFWYYKEVTSWRRVIFPPARGRPQDWLNRGCRWALTVGKAGQKRGHPTATKVQAKGSPGSTPRHVEKYSKAALDSWANDSFRGQVYKYEECASLRDRKVHSRRPSARELERLHVFPEDYTIIALG